MRGSEGLKYDPRKTDASSGGNRLLRSRRGGGVRACPCRLVVQERCAGEGGRQRRVGSEGGRGRGGGAGRAGSGLLGAVFLPAWRFGAGRARARWGAAREGLADDARYGLARRSARSDA